MTYLNTLISIGSDALIEANKHSNEIFPDLIEQEIHQMLKVKNGFYAFEGALHIFPLMSSEEEIGLIDWNENDLWKYTYQKDLDGICFFCRRYFW